MLRLYNTRTRSVEEFAPLRDGHVRIYVCGLTPSAEAHLGHARSFLFFDVLRRYLRHRGYTLTYVQNVTDIDDRSIATGKAEGVSWREIIERYFGSFKESMHRLGVADPDVEPRATEYIPQILEMIEQLIAAGHAYVTDDGIYFRVASFPRYGRLSGKNVEELLVGARIAENEHKDDPLDFALWKFSKPDEPSWPSPWGPGRPGWHIECSAMSHVLLGEPFDIHGGGYDLVFPHHENEIAQTESLISPPMANFWVHGGLLLFEQKKMSKSLGNFEPLSELLDRADAQAIRLLFLQTGYRKPMNFTDESLAGATTAINRLRKAWRVLFNGAGFGGSKSEGAELAASMRDTVESAVDYDRIVARVDGALSDDMNTAAALAVLFDAASKAEEYVARGEAKAAVVAYTYALSLLNLFADGRWLEEPKEPKLDVEQIAARLRERVGDAVHVNGASGERIIEAVIEARNAARRSKDFALADRLRDALSSERIQLHDTKEGTTWSVAAE